MSCLSLARAVKHVLQESQGQVPHPGTSGDKIPAQRSREGPADTPEGSSTPAQGGDAHTSLPSPFCGATGPAPGKTCLAGAIIYKVIAHVLTA